MTDRNRLESRPVATGLLSRGNVAGAEVITNDPAPIIVRAMRPPAPAATGCLAASPPACFTLAMRTSAVRQSGSSACFMPFGLTIAIRAEKRLHLDLGASAGGGHTCCTPGPSRVISLGTSLPRRRMQAIAAAQPVEDGKWPRCELGLLSACNHSPAPCAWQPTGESCDSRRRPRHHAVAHTDATVGKA